jgi:hypothetical protein
MRLICYPTSGEPPRIIAAPVERDWMDRTPNAFAYRCLPLNIANAHGWLILNTVPFIAEWNGDAGLDGVSISATAEGPLLASSHFGSGVLTFSVNGLFHTEPGYDLLATGPFNSPKDAIQPLTGIIETDWSPFTFTMNWKFTRKRAPVAFERDEPFCMVFPMPRGLVEAVEPEFRSMDGEPAVQTPGAPGPKAGRPGPLAIGHVARQDRPAKIQAPCRSSRTQYVRFAPASFFRWLGRVVGMQSCNPRRPTSRRSHLWPTSRTAFSQEKRSGSPFTVKRASRENTRSTLPVLSPSHWRVL